MNFEGEDCTCPLKARTDDPMVPIKGKSPYSCQTPSQVVGNSECPCILVSNCPIVDPLLRGIDIASIPALQDRHG